MGRVSFAYVLSLARSEMLRELSSKEEAIVEKHFGYLKGKLTEGKLVLAGRCLDGEFGIVVFLAKSQKGAEAFMRNNPAVKKGVMTARLHPFRVALIGSNSAVS